MKRTVKALFVFPVSQVWGGENVWLQFLSRMDRDKISPCALVFGEGELLKRLERINLPYCTLSYTRIRNVIATTRNLLLICRFLKKERVNIVNSLGVHLLTTLSTLLLNLPCVLHIHTIHPLSSIDRWCLRRAKYIVTVSNFSKQFLIRYGIKPQDIQVVYNGIDIEHLERKAKEMNLRIELGLEEDTQIVCYAGRIVRWKNLEMLIRAIPEVKRYYKGKVKFLFVGDTPGSYADRHNYKDVLLRLSRQLNVENDVVFTGRRDDIIDILKNIDIFAIPSLLEVCSMSILEAMSMGKPVVAVRMGGNPELITAETGKLVNINDVDGFARAIADLLSDREERQRLGERAFLRVKNNFSLEHSVRRMMYIQEKASLNMNTLKDIIKTNLSNREPMEDIEFRFIRRKGENTIIKIRAKTSSGRIKIYWTKINKLFFSDFLKGREIASRSYEILTGLYNAFRNDKDLGVVRPLDIISEYAAVITEDCPGRQLRDMIIGYCSSCSKRSISVRGGLEQILFNCGRWLAKFQMVTHPYIDLLQDSKSPLEIQTVESDLVQLGKIGISQSIDRRLREYFVKKIPSMKEKKLEITVCHPDLGPRNFMVSPSGKIIVLDFDYFDCRSYLDNIALFVSRLESYRRYPLINKRKLQMLKDSFLNGYQKESRRDIDTDVLHFCLVRYMVSTLAGEYLFARNRISLYRWFILKRTKSLMEEWIDENICKK